jgi:fructosamine-3-kinase
MLGLPQSTELKKIIPKKKVYEHFASTMSTERRKSFDAEIARITIVHELSTVSLNLAAGSEVQAIFVVLIDLRTEKSDPQNIAFIAKMFGQKLLLVLQYEGRQQLALWQGRLVQGTWAEPEALSIRLEGLDLDRVWESIVAQVAGITQVQGQTLQDLEEKMAAAAHREKLEKEISKLEKKAWAERQPKKKFELADRIRLLKQEIQ